MLITFECQQHWESPSLNTKNESLWYLPGRYSYSQKYDFLVLFGKICLETEVIARSVKGVEKIQIKASHQHIGTWEVKSSLVFHSRQLLVGTTHLYIFIFV